MVVFGSVLSCCWLSRLFKLDVPVVFCHASLDGLTDLAAVDLDTLGGADAV